MKIMKTIFNDAYLLAPDIFPDDRGFFYEAYNSKKFNNIIGDNIQFVQDNHSYTKKSVCRGLHYQKEPFEQDKLVRVLTGEIYDVIVDIRKRSNTFGQWHGEVLSSQNNNQLWIPKGFAHGFVVTSNDAIVLYKTTQFYSPKNEGTILYNDPDLNIEWPIKIINVSNKDLEGLYIKDIL
ncbi:MAG: dTDP-4-dehydrorhamnose 3,5-epimerase [Gammaproteobacteria bacterium]|tara:strand:- start:165 stop:701 length:537 start_codon:yes stop_codon:yes gene_type:complete